MRKGFLQHAPGVVTQVSHAQLVVGVSEHDQGLLGGARGRKLAHDRLCPVGGGYVSAAAKVVAGNSQLARSHCINQVHHALLRVCRVLALWEPVDERSKRIEGVAGRGKVALSQILPAECSEQAFLLVEIDDTFHVERVVERGMAGVELDEAVERSDGEYAFVIAIMRVGNLQLRLLGPAAERVA